MRLVCVGLSTLSIITEAKIKINIYVLDFIIVLKKMGRKMYNIRGVFGKIRKGHEFNDVWAAF